MLIQLIIQRNRIKKSSINLILEEIYPCLFLHKLDFFYYFIYYYIKQDLKHKGE